MNSVSFVLGPTESLILLVSLLEAPSFKRAIDRLLVQNCAHAHSIKLRAVQNCDVARERVKRKPTFKQLREIKTNIGKQPKCT